MPPPLRTVDPARLAARRIERGLSRAALAASAGVTARMVFFYEEGRHTPTPARLERLAAALDCAPEALTGARRGEETLVDLRYAAGLTLERAAETLRRTDVGRDLAVSAPKISALERGLSVRGRGWNDPKATGQLLKPLAKAYGVPIRMVLDAWMRTRPADTPPSPPRSRNSEPSAASKTVWDALNERQKTYLIEITRDDRMTETEIWMRRLQHLSVPPAAQWRRLPLTLDADPALVGHTRLQQRLQARGVHDPGAGSTLQALQKRGLVTVTRDIVEHPAAGTVDRVLVAVTRRGRAAARAGMGDDRKPEPPAHLLSEWLWGVLARVAAAEPDGLADDRLAGRSLFFLGVGYRDRAAGSPSRGFVDSVPVYAADGSHVTEYRWRLTDLGRRHVAEYSEVYRQMYPRAGAAVVDPPRE